LIKSQIMIGNDIVDFNDLPNIERSLSKAFLQKICANSEIDTIFKSESPEKTLWRIWSMKESAYKVILKKGAERSFNPKKLETSIFDQTLGQVLTKFGEIKCQSKITTDFVHSIAFFSNEIPFCLGEKKLIGHQSDFVRASLMEDFQHKYPHVYSPRIEMRDTIPYLITDFDSIDISLSHHGNYVAWAFECL
jgi:phosphopantetheinyl transferase (holo-ACP synthase)